MLDRAGLSFQEVDRIRNELRVVLLRDPPYTGRRASLDLEQQAGAGAGLENAVGAGTQEERFLQRIERPVNRARRCEGAEVIALEGTRSTVLGELSPFMLALDQDIGERFVVPHDDIVGRTEAFDQIRFEKQSLCFRVRRHYDHVLRACHHPSNPIGQIAGVGIAGDAVLEILRLADIKHVAMTVDHAVNTRAFRHRLEVFADDRAAVDKRAWPSRGGRLFDVGILDDGIGVGGAVSGRATGLRTALRHGHYLGLKTIPRQATTTAPSSETWSKRQVRNDNFGYPRSLWISLLANCPHDPCSWRVLWVLT